MSASLRELCTLHDCKIPWIKLCTFGTDCMCWVLSKGICCLSLMGQGRADCCHAVLGQATPQTVQALQSGLFLPGGLYFALATSDSAALVTQVGSGGNADSECGAFSAAGHMHGPRLCASALFAERSFWMPAVCKCCCPELMCMAGYCRRSRPARLQACCWRACQHCDTIKFAGTTTTTNTSTIPNPRQSCSCCACRADQWCTELTANKNLPGVVSDNPLAAPH